jgi:heme exporter protein A
VTGAPALEIDNLACVRGGRLLFRGLSLRVAAGEVLAVEGANGSGKTSLLRLIAGLLRPKEGSIRLRLPDAEPVCEPEERGRSVGWLGHQDAVKAQLTPLELLRFFAAFYGAEADVLPALERVGLAAARDLPAQYLSAGQKKRLALARLQLSQRPLWLMDEPLAALDAEGKALAAELIAAHCAAGGMAVAATHEPLGLAGVKLRLA